MISTTLTIISIGCGLASSAAWLHASRVKVSREQALKQRYKIAEKNGTQPVLSGVTLDGAEMRETLAAQSKWNSIGAILAAASVAAQAAAQAFLQN